MNTTHLLLVGAGGFFGSIARYLTVISVDKRLNSIFPFGTLTVNIFGSLLLGFLLAWVARKTGSNTDQLRLFVGTGFCGGFTTFSAFAVENVNLFQEKLPAWSVLYVMISVVGGMLAVWTGFAIARAIA
jgi:CrcB protein